MTNHIEEMMRTAGIEGSIISGTLCNTVIGKIDRILFTKYPDFTGAKQLEIIKLILLADNIDYLEPYYSEIMNSYVFECFSLPELGVRSSWAAQNKDFALALAELTVMLMNAGELDKQKVKEILER